MPEGIIIKGYSGFYYVLSESQIWECSLRGRFRLNGHEFLPGDRVRVAALKDKKGVIEELFPRKNSLLRPPAANIDQAVLVFALSSPIPDFNLLDRILIQAQSSDIAPIICFNKADLLSDEETATITDRYKAIGYRVVEVSGNTGQGVEEIKEILAGKVSVFAGPSGVGKSTLLNLIEPGLGLKTGKVSVKLQRGKHTTRHVELIPLQNGGLVADTPGFSTLELPDMRREDLAMFFPEMDDPAQTCRFSSCIHWQEPDCGVKRELDEGKIYEGRYKNYLTFMSEVIARERKF